MSRVGSMRARIVVVVAAVAAAGLVVLAYLLASGAPIALPLLSDRTVAVARPGSVELALFRLAGSVRARDGAPIANALACDHPAFSAPTTCARSASDGSFALAVAPGFHKLEVLPPPGSAYVSAWFDDRERSRDAELLDLRRADRVDVSVRLDTGRRLSGRIVATNGSAVADAQACFDPTETPAEWRCAHTDADGRYSVVVPDGEYLAFFVPPDDTRLIPRWWRGGEQVLAADPIAVHADLPGIDMALLPGFLVYGRVTATSGKPVENVLVCVDTPFPTGRVCRPTDKGGNYSVSVRRGTFIVQFVPPSDSGVVRAWYPGTSDPAAAQRVSVTSTDTRIDGVLRPGKLLWGTVRGADGGPLEGATLNVYDAERCCAFVTGGATGSSGDYAIVVPTGKFFLEVFPPLGTRYVSTYYGGETRRIIELREKDADSVADISLQPVP